MRFLLNENIPQRAILALREADFDVIAVAELMAGADDQTVLAYAREHQLVIVTFDRDYGELIYRHQLPCPLGVLYVRFPFPSPLETAKYIVHLLQQESLDLTGKFTTAAHRRIRQRPLPTTNH
jgi:predicted nuclease of predicted toxin-antitoxin system